MQVRFGGSLAFAHHHLTRPIHHDQVGRVKGTLVHTAGRHQQAQGVCAEKGTEIATRSITPTPSVDVPDHLAEDRALGQEAIVQR
jgi:hypothetical protein